MTIFLILAALMLVAAALFVALPMLRRRRTDAKLAREAANTAIYQDQLAELDADLANGTLSQTQYAQARHELERRLLQEIDDAAPAPQKSGARWPGLVAALAVPLLAAGLYWHLGHPGAINPPAPRLDPELAQQLQQIEGMVGQLEERLEAQPDDARGWVMLARAYTVLDRLPAAAEAYAKAVALLPDQPGLLADYAEVLGLAADHRLEGKPMALLEQALKLDPNHQKALALAGTGMFELQRYEEALGYWQRLLATLPADSPARADVENAIADARSRLGSAPAAAGGDAKSVSGTVSLSSALAAKAAPTDTVFVFARAAEGPKMPLAILRLTVKDLPARFRLDDTMAMMPQLKLSEFPQVVVGARISKSGSATPQPGDLEGVTEPVAPGARDLEVRIDRQIP